MRLAPNDAIDDWIDRLLEADELIVDIDDNVDEPEGPPPTEKELDATQQLLVQWQSPDDFFQRNLDAQTTWMPGTHRAKTCFARLPRA
jgi:hypothetical protein